MARTSAGYSLTFAVEIGDCAEVLGRLLLAVTAAGGDIVAVESSAAEPARRTISVDCVGHDHQLVVEAAVRSVAGAGMVSVCDRTFALHQGGKLAVASRVPLAGRDHLSMAYTPGVGRVSSAIASDPDRVWELTGRGNAVAVFTDGSAVLGLGNIGPEAALPVMEGKALLFKEFGGIDAYPICVDARGADALVAAAKAIAPGFGGINLEDIAAPVCFEVEERLRHELDIPVFHDDQHGTAVVVLAALLNATAFLGRQLADLRVAILGMGAAGVACTRLLLDAGIGDVVGVDRLGVVEPGRPGGLEGQKAWVGEHTNRSGIRGGIAEALCGADVFIGVSGPGLVTAAELALMKPDSVVFALANPIPEITPEAVPGNVAVVATGRSDFPNQINNVLVFPGVFRGLLDSRAHAVDTEMKLAAAGAIAGLLAPDELSPTNIIPSVFDRRVAPAVAAAVVARSGLASSPL